MHILDRILDIKFSRLLLFLIKCVGAFLLTFLFFMFLFAVIIWFVEILPEQQRERSRRMAQPKLLSGGLKQMQVRTPSMYDLPSYLRENRPDPLEKGVRKID